MDSVDERMQRYVERFDEIDPVVEGIVDRLLSIEKVVQRLFDETLAEHGLSVGEYRLLARLATAPPPGRMSAGELARVQMLSSGGMTARLDRLEQSGLVRRVRDPGDRRGVLVELTAKGTSLIDRAVSTQARREVDVLSSLSPTEKDRLTSLLRKVLGDLETRFPR